LELPRAQHPSVTTDPLTSAFGNWIATPLYPLYWFDHPLHIPRASVHYSCKYKAIHPLPRALSTLPFLTKLAARFTRGPSLPIRSAQPRTFTMAWRSSGSSNEALINNLKQNGLIENDRVKEAMLKVLPSSRTSSPHQLTRHDLTLRARLTEPTTRLHLPTKTPHSPLATLPQYLRPTCTPTLANRSSHTSTQAPGSLT
jgi:hypothetical protein